MLAYLKLKINKNKIIIYWLKKLLKVENRYFFFFFNQIKVHKNKITITNLILKFKMKINFMFYKGFMFLKRIWMVLCFWRGFEWIKYVYKFIKIH